MSTPVYVSGERLTEEQTSSLVESFVIGIYDGIIEDLVGGLEVNLTFKFKLPGFLTTADSAYEISQSGDDYLVNGIVIATGAVSAAAFASFITGGLIGAGILASSGAGVVVIGAAAATAFTIIWDSVLEDPLSDFLGILLGGLDEEFVLKAPDGTILGSALYKDGIGTLTEIAAAENLASYAFQDPSMEDPVVGAQIEHIRGSGSVLSTEIYEVAAGDIFEIIAQSQPGTVTEAQVKAWGWAQDTWGNSVSNNDILRVIGSSGLLLFSLDSKLAVRVVDEIGQLVNLSISLEKVAFDGMLPSDPGGVQVLLGGDGNDILAGNAATKIYALGGKGVDAIVGSDGDDVIYGGDGNDGLAGGSGDDILVGGKGDDFLNGEAGTDTVRYAEAVDPTSPNRSSGIIATQSTLGFGNVADGFGGMDTLSAIEVVEGTRFDDQFAVIGDLSEISSEAALRFDGGVDGSGEVDGDVLDLISVTSAAPMLVYLSNGFGGSFVTDIFTVSPLPGDGKLIVDNIESIIGSAEPDQFIARANLDAIDGMILDANDSIGAKDFLISPYLGNQVTTLNADGDLLDLTFLVPSGTLGAFVDLDNQDTEEKTDGTLDFGTASVTVINFENIFGSIGGDTFYGSDDNNAFFGFDGNDTLVGRGGEDLLVGDDGDDILYGGTWVDDATEEPDPLNYVDDGFIDLLFGGAHNDTYYVSNNDQVWDMTLEQQAQTAFESDGNGTVYFNGIQLGEAEWVEAEESASEGYQRQLDWYDYSGAGTTLAVFKDHTSGFVYRVFQAVTIVGGQQVNFYSLGVEDWNTQTVFEIGNVAYDPVAHTLGFPTPPPPAAATSSLTTSTGPTIQPVEVDISDGHLGLIHTVADSGASASLLDIAVATLTELVTSETIESVSSAPVTSGCQRRRKNQPCGGAKVYHFGVPGAGDGNGLSALSRALPR